MSHPALTAIASAGGAAYLDEIPHSTHDRRALAAAADLDLIIRTGASFYQLPGTDRRIVLARRFRGHLTCVSAAEIYGYPTRRKPVRVHLALRHNHAIRETRSRPTRPVRIHREQVLSPTTVEGFPLVTPTEVVARALLCPDVEDIDALAILDSSLNQGHVTASEVGELLKGQRAARARSLLAKGDPHARSILETMVRSFLLEAGLAVRTGVVIRGVGELDHLVENVLDVETDGFEYHRTREQIQVDHERDQRLLSQGIVPLRLSYEHVMEGGEGIVRIVRAALAGLTRLELPQQDPASPEHTLLA